MGTCLLGVCQVGACLSGVCQVGVCLSGVCQSEVSFGRMGEIFSYSVFAFEGSY